MSEGPTAASLDDLPATVNDTHRSIRPLLPLSLRETVSSLVARPACGAATCDMEYVR